MSLCIIVGDSHLGLTSGGKVGIGTALNSRIIDQFDLLDWNLERAIELQADHIIMTGDTFDHPAPPSYLVNMFFAWLKKCQVNQIQVHIILGNHCILRNGMHSTSVLDAINEIEFDSIFVYKDITTITIDKTSFTFMPFRDRKSLAATSNAEGLEIIQNQLDYELAGIPVNYSKVVIGHFAIEGSIPVGDEIDDLTNELFCPVSMFNGFDYIWMGHVHKPQVMQKANPYIAHIGSMDISNFGETDHKKHIVVFDCETQNWHPEILPTRALQKISITVPKDTVDTTAYVLDEINKAKVSDKGIVKVEVVLSTPELLSINKSTIEKHILSKGAFSVSGISESKKVRLIKKDNSGNIDNIDSKMDVVSAIKTYSTVYVEEKLRPAFTELSLEILSAAKIDGGKD